MSTINNNKILLTLVGISLAQVAPCQAFRVPAGFKDNFETLKKKDTSKEFILKEIAAFQTQKQLKAAQNRLERLLKPLPPLLPQQNSLYCPEPSCWQAQGNNCLLHGPAAQYEELCTLLDSEIGRIERNIVENRSHNYIHADYCSQQKEEPDNIFSDCRCSTVTQWLPKRIKHLGLKNKIQQEENRLTSVGAKQMDKNVRALILKHLAS